MALKLPKFLNFAEADAKTRVFILVGVVVIVAAAVFFLVQYVSGPKNTVGPSHVAGAPSNLQSIPGSQLSPEYYRALQQANVQAAQQAKISGGSAVPTLVNIPGQGGGNCTSQCPNEETADVTPDINDLLQQGKLSQDDANQLLDLAKKNVSVDEYAAALAQLVKDGKLTPDQARALLEKYRKQHGNALVNASANMMDGLIKSGQLSLDAANDLLDLQKKGVTPAEYAAELNRLVKEGKMPPNLAADLLAQYSQQKVNEMGKTCNFNLRQMARGGQISSDISNDLTGLQTKRASVDQYGAEIKKFIDAGKIAPVTASKLLDEYKSCRQVSSSAITDLISKGGKAAECGNQLTTLRGNNASTTDYTNELKRCVQTGVLSPEEAASLLQEYQSITVPVGATPTGVETNIPGAAEFAKLQQRVQGQAAISAVTPESFTTPAPSAEAVAASNQARAQSIQNLSSAMSSQASSLVSAWQPPAMSHQTGSTEKGKEGKTEAKEGEAKAGEAKAGEAASQPPPGPVLIKAGSIMFAILETAVNSDYPDTPVMATIVSGKYRGGKLLGKLALAKDQDRVTLNFNLMNLDEWPQSKSITAFAIDPETAKTALATTVDYHYIKRYGGLFASSLMTGYAQAFTQSGATTSTNVFGTTTTTAKLNPAQKLIAAFGNVGTAFSNIWGSYVNTPYTVQIKAGIDIGILFMADVTQ